MHLPVSRITATLTRYRPKHQGFTGLGRYLAKKISSPKMNPDREKRGGKKERKCWKPQLLTHSHTHALPIPSHPMPIPSTPSLLNSQKNNKNNSNSKKPPKEEEEEETKRANDSPQGRNKPCMNSNLNPTASHAIYKMSLSFPQRQKKKKRKKQASRPIPFQIMPCHATSYLPILQCPCPYPCPHPRKEAIQRETKEEKNQNQGYSSNPSSSCYGFPYPTNQ